MTPCHRPFDNDRASFTVDRFTVICECPHQTTMSSSRSAAAMQEMMYDGRHTDSDELATGRTSGKYFARFQFHRQIRHVLFVFSRDQDKKNLFMLQQVLQFTSSPRYRSRKLDYSVGNGVSCGNDERKSDNGSLSIWSGDYWCEKKRALLTIDLLSSSRWWAMVRVIGDILCGDDPFNCFLG